LPGNLEKPEIFPCDGKGTVFTAGADYRNTMKILESSGRLITEGTWSTAIAFYSWLKKTIAAKYPVTDYISSRNSRGFLNDRTSRILVKVKNHCIDLKKAPHIPWLKVFYPDHDEFLISLPDILGLNGSWQWYKKGIRYALLEHALHPFYGVYFPTRTGHLEMFDRWLDRNRGRFSSATDIGTGCGILSFLMVKQGIENIHATDINPNAVYSIRKEVERLSMTGKITIEQLPLFGSQKKAGELTVFNPPWIPGTSVNNIDMGIYYEAGFFRDFFNEAKCVITSGSYLAMIFSNFAIEAGIADQNPIEMEISSGTDFLLEEKITRNVIERASGKRSWINSIRQREKTELWILKRI
jgi:hypothetical protein